MVDCWLTYMYSDCNFYMCKSMSTCFPCSSTKFKHWKHRSETWSVWDINQVSNQWDPELVEELLLVSNYSIMFNFVCIGTPHFWKNKFANAPEAWQLIDDLISTNTFQNIVAVGGADGDFCGANKVSCFPI